VLLPFMIITLQSVIEGIDRSVEEAALNLGAGPVTMFARVIVPLASPGLLAGTLLCFILAMNAYATPVLLGGPKFHMMAPTVYEQIIKVSNWPFGAALSFMLMSLSAAAVIVAGLLMHRRAAR
jgi:putative spermidine/putrescine transport system permease protein